MRDFAKFTGKPLCQSLFFNKVEHLLGDCFCKVTKMKLYFTLDIQKFTISNRITHNTVAVVRRCSVKKVSLEITQHLQENTCARVSFLIKLQALKPATLFKRRLWHRCFPVNVAKFLRIPFLQNTSCGCF